jgi:hypothetical protein
LADEGFDEELRLGCGGIVLVHIEHSLDSGSGGLLEGHGGDAKDAQAKEEEEGYLQKKRSNTDAKAEKVLSFCWMHKSRTQRWTKDNTRKRLKSFLMRIQCKEGVIQMYIRTPKM